jgi:hypothetical protein
MARLLSLSGSFSILVLALSACKNQTPPAAEANAAEPAQATPSAAPAALPAAADSGPAGAAEPAAQAAAAASKYTEAGFDLVLEPKGDYSAGKEGEADIVLSAKAPFHVNQQYPYKFKLKESPGLSFANMVVSKEAVKLEPARATLPVAFTPAAAGKHTVSGQLSFSVCTADQCMIEKRDLALEIEAK